MPRVVFVLVCVQVQVLIRVLQKAETSNLPVFTYQFSELSKVHTCPHPITRPFICPLADPW